VPSFVLFVILRSRQTAANIRERAVMKILLVEDSDIERQRIGGYLADWGLEFLAVGSGTESVQLLDATEPPNMALLDWMLPGLDGFGTLPRVPGTRESTEWITQRLSNHRWDHAVLLQR
jgi:CheY-like chemotaxis protein